MIPGKKIYLRPIENCDGDFLSNLANHPAVSGAVVGFDFPISASGQTRWLEDATNNPSTKRLIVARKSDDAAIGLTGLWDIDWHNQSALSAVKLHPDLTERGQGTDTIMTVMAWAFYCVNLRRLYGSILDFNAASLGAYVKKCGWRIEGRAKEAIFRRGAWHDLYQVAALRSDFETLSEAKTYIDLCAPVDTDSKYNATSLKT